jgi:hypothetical protein
MAEKYMVSGQPMVWDVNKVHYLVCCDCGMEHLVMLDMKGKNKVEIRMYRDQWGTLQERRAMRRKK